MKKIVSIILTLTVLCSMTAFAHPFSDANGHWAEEEIEKAYQSGMVNGNPDGRFRPNDKISRAEFLKMLTAIICERAEVDIPEIYDDGTHWAAKYYNFAIGEGMFAPLGESVNGITPGKMSKADFDIPIERWEMSYLVSETMRNVCGIEGRDQGQTYTDVETTAANYSVTVSEAINNCFLMGIMTGDENGNLNPAKGGTRAEAVVIVNRVDGILQELLAMMEQTTQQQQESSGEVKVYEEIPTGHPVVTIVMDDGQEILIELYPEYAPQTVANFVELVKSGFYDGVGFHRVIEGFMAQGGDPEGTGMGGSGYAIMGEFAANGFEGNTLSHTRGVISMARAQSPNSASSQFFICYDDASFLDGNYAAFGKVISGMNVVDGFLQKERVPNAMGEVAVPVEPLIMKKVTVNMGK